MSPHHRRSKARESPAFDTWSRDLQPRETTVAALREQDGHQNAEGHDMTTRHTNGTAPRRDPETVQTWAADFLRRARWAGPIPELGTPAWAALHERDNRKWAAALLVALHALHDATPVAIAARLRAERAELDRLMVDRIKEAAEQVSEGLDWSRVAYAHVPFDVAAARRLTYATPALTPEQIRAKASQPWECDRPARAETAA